MKTLLVIGFVWPEPNSSAAGSRMLQLIQVFQSQNYKVVFATACSKSEHAFDLSSIQVESKAIVLNDSSFDDFIKDLHPDAVLFDRFIIEEQFGWRVTQHCPNALRILDTEDLHCLRKGRCQAFKDGKLFDKNYVFNDSAKREIASIYRSDLSLIISEAEMSILQNDFKVPGDLLHYLPFLFEVRETHKKSSLSSFKKRQHFMTIGNFLHPPNLDSVKFLKEIIWPKIKKQLKDAELHIYGAYLSDKVMQYEDKNNGLYIKGFAENVNEVMLNARVCLAPLRYGAGLKGKFFDAMYNGTPFITTTIGAEGIIDKNLQYDFVTDDVEAMVKHAVSLYREEPLWLKQQELGFNLLSNKFSKSLHLGSFLNKLDDVHTNKEAYRLNNFTGAMLNFHTMQSTKYMSRWIEEKHKNSEHGRKG